MRTTTMTIALLMILPAALATHTPEWGCGGEFPAGGIIEISGGTADTTFYVDDRNLLFGDNVWIYMESNGIWTGLDPRHDLQRGAAHFLLGGDDLGWTDPCVDDPNVLPDTLLY